MGGYLLGLYLGDPRADDCRVCLGVEARAVAGELVVISGDASLGGFGTDLGGGVLGVVRPAGALADYYSSMAEGFGRYGARFPGGPVTTSVLTQPDWLDLECSLTSGSDLLTFTCADRDRAAALDTPGAEAAAQRLAETLTAGTRFTESTLYRLTNIDIAPGKLGGTFGPSRFTSYALTPDLLEGELDDALTAGVRPVPGSLPLRDRYLPDVTSVLDVSGRLCAGGALALCAFARPATFYRDPADYVLLVQERSGNVINAARRLAVIPKGFHQPMTTTAATQGSRLRCFGRWKRNCSAGKRSTTP